MTISINQREIEFLGADENQSILRGWYDTLHDSKIKSAIKKVRWREFRPYDQENFRLVVLCQHPFTDLAAEIESASNAGNYLKSDRALSTLVSSFTRWAENQGIPDEVFLGKRHAFVDWWPVEMLHYVSFDISPQAQAQLDMSNHALECLDLIRLATIPEPEFLSLWTHSNEPFFAAGRLFYGTFRWVREVPRMNQSEAYHELLLERVNDFTREYVGLLRLALHAGAESPLLERFAFVLRRFKIQHAVEIPAWLAIARQLLEGLEDLPLHAAVAAPSDYEAIDQVCDKLRLSLVKAAEGLEDEIPALINAVLPTLRIPTSAGIFAA